jgi:hypothetical protein
MPHRGVRWDLLPQQPRPSATIITAFGRTSPAKAGKPAIASTWTGRIVGRLRRRIFGLPLAGRGKAPGRSVVVVGCMKCTIFKPGLELVRGTHLMQRVECVSPGSLPTRIPMRIVPRLAAGRSPYFDIFGGASRPATSAATAAVKLSVDS